MNSHPTHKRANRSSCGLYIHIPFCQTKCGYCDFFSIPLRDRDPAAVMLQLQRELEWRVATCPCEIRTVFCGGGTPTILPSPQLSTILQAVKRIVPPSPLVEFTIEANPVTIDHQKADLLAEAGVNRVSLGAQSFLPDELAILDRAHNPEDVASSISVLRHNDRFKVNLDLIFGIPGQTRETWGQSLRRAIELDPDHLSCYGLTYEEGTTLTCLRDTGQVQPAANSVEADMYLDAVAILSQAGYEQYEISSFAKPGCRCKHNLLYWHNKPYIGIGPSAVGCINDRRYKNVSDLDAYVRMMTELGNAELESETLGRQMVITEMMMMQLRLVEGLSVEAFRDRVGLDPNSLFEEPLAWLEAENLVKITPTHIALTPRGRLIGDSVITKLATDQRGVGLGEA